VPEFSAAFYHPNGKPWSLVLQLSREAIPKMKRTIQVRIFRGEQQYVAECLDLPVVTEAPTLDQLTANIQEAIALHLEGENLEDLGFADNPTILATMELLAVA
jgi:predicted RNase H-like HicB family nuclease